MNARRRRHKQWLNRHIERLRSIEGMLRGAAAASIAVMASVRINAIRQTPGDTAARTAEIAAIVVRASEGIRKILARASFG